MKNGNESFRISFTLDAEDANYFRRRYRKAKAAAKTRNSEEILAQARTIVAQAKRSRKTPKFVLDAISTLEDLAHLVEDKEYAAPPKLRDDVLAGIAYFADPDDLIPDDVPGLGFLDDAIMIHLIANDFRHDLRGYRKFKRTLDNLHHKPSSAPGRARREKAIPALRSRIRGEITAIKARDEARSPFKRIAW